MPGALPPGAAVVVVHQRDVQRARPLLYDTNDGHGAQCRTGSRRLTSACQLRALVSPRVCESAGQMVTTMTYAGSSACHRASTGSQQYALLGQLAVSGRRPSAGHHPVDTMMPGPPWLPWSAWGIPPPAVAPNGLGGADLSRCDPRAGSVTAVTEQTRTGTPTKTVVINYHDPYRNELARWDYYQEVSPGQLRQVRAEGPGACVRGRPVPGSDRPRPGGLAGQRRDPLDDDRDAPGRR